MSAPMIPLDIGDTAPMPASSAERADLLAAGGSHVGRVRKRNEDCYLIADLDRSFSPRDSNLEMRDHEAAQGCLLVVADGMGGHGSGDVASATAIRAVAAYANNLLPWIVELGRGRDGEVMKELEQALRRAQDDVIAAGYHDDAASSRMGTTLTMAYLVGRTAHVVHAGDSRCYVHRDGRLAQLTHDHTVASELERQGVLGPGESRSSRFKHVLSNCIAGGDPDLDVELHRFELEPGDTLMLCTDGLTGHVGDSDIAAMLAATGEPQQAVDRLIAAALDDGGTDNVTVVVCKVTEQG